MNSETKEYIPNLTKKEILVNDPDHEYMFFDVLSDKTLMSKFKEEYVKLSKEPLLYKLIVNKIEWFNMGSIYVPSEKEFFEMGLVPLKKFVFNYKKIFIDDNRETININRYKKVVTKEGTYYLFIPYGFIKIGRTYTSSPVIKVSEDIYNLAKISAGKFTDVTKDDISMYSKFFKVSEVPYMVKSEAYIEKEYRNGDITNKEYSSLLEEYTREEKLVKSLKKN